ncbi:MAG TPA: hypothetical protein VF596_18640 [Pyrinomonadaceae bacterium]
MGEVIETTEKYSSWILELPDEIAGKEGYGRLESYFNFPQRKD